MGGGRCGGLALPAAQVPALALGREWVFACGGGGRLNHPACRFPHTCRHCATGTCALRLRLPQTGLPPSMHRGRAASVDDPLPRRCARCAWHAPPPSLPHTHIGQRCMVQHCIPPSCHARALQPCAQTPQHTRPPGRRCRRALCPPSPPPPNPSALSPPSTRRSAPLARQTTLPLSCCWERGTGRRSTGA